MNVTELERTYRVQTADYGDPPLCSFDDFLVRLNEAQVEAARRARLLVDSSTPEMCVIDVSAGDAEVPLDPRVILVRRVTLGPRRQPLRMALVKDMDECMPGWESHGPATPAYFIPDWQSNALRLDPPPGTDTTVYLTVVREPLAPLEKDEEVPEIAPRYHLPLLEWVKHRTYTSQDAEALDPKAAATALALFTAEFGPPVGAIDEYWLREQAYEVGER